MRNISSTISSFGIQIIRQGILLIVRREAFRSLCVNSSQALQWCTSWVSTDTREVMWHAISGNPARRMACCYALAKQQERHPRVTGYRSVD